MSSANVDLSENRGPAILGAVISVWSVAVLAVVLRFIARKMSKVGLWLDDYLIFVGTLLYTAMLAILIHNVRLGVGRHIQVVDPSGFQTIFIIHYSGELIFLWAIAMIKWSILAFYWRIWKVSTLKIPILLVSAIVVAWLVASTFATIFQCSPVKKEWLVNLPGHCLPLARFFLATSIPEVITDFAILAMPVPYIWRLQTKLRQKMVLTVIFVIGGLACVSSIVRLWAFVVHDYSSLDFTYLTSNLTIWSCVEVGIAVTCACLPSMKPIFSGTRAWYAKRTLERSASGRSLPSNPFLRHLMMRRSGDEASRPSTSEEAGLCLRENSQTRADHAWQPNLGYAPPIPDPMSQIITTHPRTGNESV